MVAVTHPMRDRAQQRHLTGWAIKSIRGFQKMSRAEFARRLTEITGDEWSEPMVQELERGGKAQTAEIIDAVRRIQGMPISWYFDGPECGIPTSKEVTEFALGGRDSNPQPIDYLATDLPVAA